MKRIELKTETEGYSIILNSCFIHKAYLEMFFDHLIVPTVLRDYIDGQRNCEDILMSVIVTKFLMDINRAQSGVLAIKAVHINYLEDEICKLLIAM